MSSEDRDPSRPPDSRPLEEELRALLQPAPGVASRVIAGALNDPVVAARALPRLAWLAASALAVSLLATGLWWASFRPPPPATPPSSAAGFHIGNSGGLVTVVAPSGQVKALISGDSR